MSKNHYFCSYMPQAYEPYRKALKREASVIDPYDLWRKTALTLKLSKAACLRLEWMIYYFTTAKENGALVSRHFGLHRNTFGKWLRKFDPNNLRNLESQGTRPRRVRKRQGIWAKDERIISLRKEYPCWGKKKLKVLYERRYQETITEWYIQRVIEDYHLYFRKKKKRISNKRKTGQVRKRITELTTTKKETGFLLHFDSIILQKNNQKRYIITGIDHHSRFAYAWMYSRHNSQTAEDFLRKIFFLLNNSVQNIHTDNGSEFKKYFEKAVQKQQLIHYWSRPKTPKDNPINERFNRTLKEEFLHWGNYHPDPHIFNRNLTSWLITYNTIRPHESLNFSTPLEVAQKSYPLHTRWSSCTST